MKISVSFCFIIAMILPGILAAEENTYIIKGPGHAVLINENGLKTEITNSDLKLSPSSKNSTSPSYVSPFYPSISRASLDNGYSIIGYQDNLFLCYIDAEKEQLLLLKNTDGKTWNTDIKIADVKYGLSNGQSLDISENIAYVCWKDKDKLYFSKANLLNLSFTTQSLISSEITGIPSIKINNDQINIIVSKNNQPAFFKSMDGGQTWIEKKDISAKKLTCRNNPSYGIAAPVIVNAGGEKIITAYASPELTIQSSNNNGLTWENPVIISEEPVLNGFSIQNNNEHLECYWVSGNKVNREEVPLKTIGLDSEAALDLNNVVVYPNPFKPSESISGHVTFANITSDVEIKIYTLSGELVDEIKLSNTSGKAIWDCRNKDDQDAASGVYLYLIKNQAGEKKTGKIAVIR